MLRPRLDRLKPLAPVSAKSLSNRLTNWMPARGVTLTPLISGIFFGRYVLKLNPLLLLGGIAGAQTMIAGVAAVQEKSDSPVATLGYSYTAAIGHILLTTWGTVIVGLMS